MNKQLISSGSSFEQVAGYSRAVTVNHGAWSEVLISGVTGFDYKAMTISEDPVAQTRQCFANIAAVLAQAGGDLSAIVRVRYLLSDAALWDKLAPVFGEFLSDVRPAATAFVCGLVDPRMKIEIEVDARIGL